MLEPGFLFFLLGVFLVFALVRVVSFTIRAAIAVAFVAGGFLVLRHFGLV